MDDDDAKLGVGLGCNGIIHILIEPIGRQPQNPINLLKSLIESRRPGVLVTLFALDDRKGRQPGTCLCLTGNGCVENGLDDAGYREALISDAEKVWAGQRSSTAVYTDQNSYMAFVDYLKPVISLVVVGAGNDAIPLTNIAAVLGWNITVIDGRPNYAVIQRFPAATRVITAKPEQVLSEVELNEQTAFVLMTHNYNYELALLKALLPQPVAYIGVLGPRKKLERMLGELEDSGAGISQQQLNNLYGPVGLDIGSEGAEEIALSIVAEIKAVLSSREGYSLKYRPAAIHSAVPANAAD
jgi:xanthine dehydrogenase accessory factor